MKTLKQYLSILLIITLCISGNTPMQFCKQVDAATTTTLSNPRIETDGMSTWDCIWFGNYPQAEVITTEMNENYLAVNSNYRKENDVVVSDSIYSELKEATGWDDNGDITIGNVRYRRMLKSDATYYYPGSSNYYYYWSDSKTYHYFKYEQIKWRVLNVKDGVALIMANIALDNQKYHTSSTDVTWETCTLRSWLNGYSANKNSGGKDYVTSNFINAAFSNSEKEAINNTTLSNNENQHYGTSSGNATTDRIFLLSESEMCSTNPFYGFSSSFNTYDEARQCKSSTYAKAMGTGNDTTISYAGNCWWWLRSSGRDSNCATDVLNSGYIDTIGASVDKFTYAVRPALYLNLSSSVWNKAGIVTSSGDEISTDLSTSSPLPSPSIVDDTNSFNEYIYRANHLTDTSEIEGSTMENGYINADTPSEILLKELQKNGFSYTADAWRAVTRACDSASDASKIVDYAVEEKDIYEAIILNALESAAKYDVVDSINADVIKETNELLQLIKNDLKMNYSIDIYDSTQNTNLTKEMRIRTKELAEEYYEQKNISKAAEWLGNFEEVMAYLDTAEDFCEELTSYINIRNINDSMKSVLKEMKKNCPSNNKALAFALDDCVKVLDTSDSEFAKQMLEGGLKTVGAEAVKAGISKFWGKIVVAKVEKLCPRWSSSKRHIKRPSI